MERLTYFDNGKWRVKIGDTEYSGETVDRLAAYEDTGLEPEAVEHLKLASMGRAVAEITEFEGIPIARLRELAQADREGEIPKYTIGDTIYDRFGNAWKVTAVERRLLAGEPKWIYRCGHIGTDDYFALWEFEVLTCEEAKAALRREQDGNNK